MNKPQECQTCDLVQLSTEEKPLTRGFSLPTGTGRLGVAAIGESLGTEEYYKGRPFVSTAQAGSKFEECVKLAGISRDDLLVWNVCACQPLNPMNSLEGREDAIAHCKTNFDNVVLRMQPGNCGKRVLLTLGSIASRTMVSGFAGIGEWRGFTFLAKRQNNQSNINEGRNESNNGEILSNGETDYGLCIPTFHPSFIKRGNPELTPLLAFDLQRAIEVANGTFCNYLGNPACISFNIHEFPSLEDGWQFYYRARDNNNLVVAFDIETPKTGTVTEEERGDLEPEPITQIQFALDAKYAIVFPWRAPYLDVIKAILELPNVKAGHYVYGFDLRRLKDAGYPVKGKIHDTMWCFKTWHPRLPRGLQNVASMAGFPFPWKHFFNERMQYYGGCDVIAPHLILRWLPPLMKKLGVWQGYIDNVFQEFIYLQGASDRGLPVNDKARLELRDTLKGERRLIHKELQELVPDELKGIEPKRKQENGAFDYGYKKEPVKLLKLAKEQWEKWRLEEGGREGVSFETYLLGLTFKAKADKSGKQKEFRLRWGEFPYINAATGETKTVGRWYRELVFKASSAQLIGYLNWKREEILKQ